MSRYWSQYLVNDEIVSTAAANCIKKYYQAIRQYSAGAFIPRCKPDGTFEMMQCQGSYCYCANENGIEVAGTRLDVKYGKPHCLHLKPGATCERCAPGTSPISKKNTHSYWAQGLHLSRSVKLTNLKAQWEWVDGLSGWLLTTLLLLKEYKLKLFLMNRGNIVRLSKTSPFKVRVTCTQL